MVAVYFLLPAIPLTDNRTITLDPGTNFYYYVAFNIFKDGQLSGQFSESQGHAVNAYIFDNSQYDSFRSGGNPQSLFSSTGPSAESFSASIPQP